MATKGPDCPYRLEGLTARSLCRGDEPGAWYACLPLETVLTFDPVPPPPLGRPLPGRPPTADDAASAAGSSAARQASMEDFSRSEPSGTLGSDPGGTLGEPWPAAADYAPGALERAALSPPRSPGPPCGREALAPEILKPYPTAPLAGAAGEDDVHGMDGDGDDFVGPPLPPPTRSPPPPPPMSPPPPPMSPLPALPPLPAAPPANSGGGGTLGGAEMSDAEEEEAKDVHNFVDGPRLGLGFPRSERSGAAAMSLSSAASASRGPAPMSVSGPASPEPDDSGGGGGGVAGLHADCCNGLELCSGLGGAPDCPGAGAPGPCGQVQEPFGDVGIDSRAAGELPSERLTHDAGDATGLYTHKASSCYTVLFLHTLPSFLPQVGTAMAATSPQGTDMAALMPGSRPTAGSKCARPAAMPTAAAAAREVTGKAATGAPPSWASCWSLSLPATSSAARRARTPCLFHRGVVKMWTVYVADEETEECMVLPRLAALAEVMQSC